MDNFQQYVQTQQVQTYQVQTDHSAVKAIDAGIQSMGIKEAFDARVNELFEGAWNAIKHYGGKLKEKMSQGISYAHNKVDGLSNKLSPDPTPTIHQANAIAGPEKTPQIAPDIVASAKDACVGMPTLNYASFANDFNPSPSASPVVGFGVAQSYGMSAG